jgi:hypothetical protein
VKAAPLRYTKLMYPPCLARLPSATRCLRPRLHSRDVTALAKASCTSSRIGLQSEFLVSSLHSFDSDSRTFSYRHHRRYGIKLMLDGQDTHYPNGCSRTSLLRQASKHLQTCNPTENNSERLGKCHHSVTGASSQPRSRNRPDKCLSSCQEIKGKGAGYLAAQGRTSLV